MLLLLTASAAVLADSPSSTAQPIDETITVTGTRLPAGAEEVESRPGGADFVKAEDYKDKLAVSLRDALIFSPGVYTQPRFGQEIRLSIRGSGISRGFHMRGLTLLQDGVPINLADDNGDFQELDPAILQHLEIYRGANAFRFGGTTLGGAINGVTATGRTAPGINLRIDGGSFDTLRGAGSFGWAADGLDGRITLTSDRSDGDRQHDKRDSLRAHANVGVRLSGNAETRLYVSLNHIDQEMPGALSYADATNFPKKGSFVGDQHRNIDSVRLQNRTTVNLAGVGLEFGGFLNAKKLFHPIFQVVDQDSLDKGLFARAGWESGPLKLLAGATARFGTVDSQRFVNVDGRRGSRTLDADQKARTIDVYSEARFDTGPVTLIGGAIYTNGMRRQDQHFPAEVVGKSTFSELSPRFGLVWKAASKIEVYANVSRSHELPGFIELAQVAAFVPLDAQHAWTTEVGARGSFGAARFDVSLYRANVRNELLQFNVGPDIPASTFNADETLHQGIEAGLDLQLAPWASLRQTYQFNDFRFRDDAQFGNNRLPVIPKHLYRAELKLGPEKWNVSPSLEWVPQGAWADYANSFRTGGYAMLGVSGSVALAKSAEVFVDARNLANRKAVGDISAVVDYRTLQPFQRVIFYPVERRALYAGVRAHF